MNSNSSFGKKVVLGIGLLMVAGFFGIATVQADSPLSKDDITLLLLGSSPSAKIIQMVEQRGVDFQLTPDLAKKFHDQGASDDLIDALQKAGNKTSTAAPSAPAPAGETKSNNPEPATGETKPNSPAAPAAPPATPPVGTSSEPVLHVRKPAASDAGAASPQAAAEGKPGPAPPAQASSDAATEQKIQETLAELTKGPETNARQAPTLRIQEISGRKLTPEDFRDRVVLVNFWATWCPACQTEVPALIRLQARYRDEGLQVVGIAVNDSTSRVKEYSKEHGINYPVAMGDETLKVLYGGVEGLPTSFLIGRDGRIYRKITGAPMDVGVFEQSIKMLLKAPAVKPRLVAQAPPAMPAAPNAAAAAPRASPSPVPVTPVSAIKPAAPENPPIASAPGLKDPDSAEVQHVIQEFAAKEKVFREARNNYTYHQVNKVQELGADNEVVGTFQQEWDILYDDSGKRIERVTYAPQDTLKGLIVTQEDIENFRNIQPFVLTTDELPEYEVRYLGHVKVDEITAYVFSIRPKQIQKDRLYFQGVVWVDDRDLQIVKSEGKTVPELKGKKGQNLFPRFTTWREQIDGKFWFPTYTLADDTLYFPNGPAVHMKEIVRYSDYKQFKSGVRILTVESIDKQKSTTTPAPTTPNK